MFVQSEDDSMGHNEEKGDENRGVEPYTSLNPLKLDPSCNRFNFKSQPRSRCIKTVLNTIESKLDELGIQPELLLSLLTKTNAE